MADFESLCPEAILDGIHVVDVGADDDLIGAARLRERDHAVDADVEIGENGRDVAQDARAVSDVDREARLAAVETHDGDKGAEDVRGGDDADELANLGEDGDTADLLALHDERRLLDRHRVRDGDDVLLHDIGDLELGEQGADFVAVERRRRRRRGTQEITVCEKSDELSVLHDRKAAEMSLVHELCRLIHPCLRSDCDGILGHTVGNKHKCFLLANAKETLINSAPPS